MAERKRTAEELEIDFKRQVNFLNSSCKAFDEGMFDEAIRMAVTLRVLLHDKGRNVSVLQQMGIKEKMKFIDTSLDFKPDNLFAHLGLLVIRVGNGESDSGYRPLLKTNGISRLLSFNEWWGKVVIQDLCRNDFTRKELVLFVADQDGGAHLDPEINEKYAKLSRDHTLGWRSTVNGVFKEVPDAVFHCIRQIAFEVLTTFDERFAL